MTYHDEQNATKAHGWAKDAGPLATLDNLGILPRRSPRPDWLNYQKTLTTATGTVIYKCSTKRLDRDSLRAFAALTLENWNVIVTSPPGTGEFDVRITAAPTLTPTD